MNTYRITSSAGVEMGTYRAESALRALDMLALDAGYDAPARWEGPGGPHHVACAETGAKEDDWTTDYAEFRRGSASLFVEAIDS